MRKERPDKTCLATLAFQLAVIYHVDQYDDTFN